MPLPSFAVGHRRIYRLYRTLGLKLRSKRRRYGACAPRSRLPESTAANERWSMDFDSDQLCDGRTIRVLTIVDEFSKLCPALEVDTSITGVRVGRTLDRAIELYGKPKLIVMDNGPEFTSKALDQWATRAACSCTGSRRASRRRTDSARASTTACATNA